MICDFVFEEFVGIILFVDIDGFDVTNMWMINDKYVGS